MDASSKVMAVAVGSLVGAVAVGACVAALTMSISPWGPRCTHPTVQASDGTWVEGDGEPMDSDPCDNDDKLEKPKPVVSIVPPKPPVKTPAKPAAPIGGTKKRF